MLRSEANLEHLRLSQQSIRGGRSARVGGKGARHERRAAPIAQSLRPGRCRTGRARARKPSGLCAAFKCLALRRDALQLRLERVELLRPRLRSELRTRRRAALGAVRARLRIGSSKMLGGTSQIVSMIRVKCNGK